MKKLEQGIRLETILKELGITQNNFAKLVGISQAYVSLMLSGKKSISYSVIQNITKYLPQVNIKWLLLGEGEMFIEQKSEEVQKSDIDHKPVKWIQDLAAMLDQYESRIARLEAEVTELKNIIQNKN